MPAWTASLKRALFGNARVAYCDDAAAASPAVTGGSSATPPTPANAGFAAAGAAAATGPSAAAKVQPKPAKKYKPLPRPGPFQACDGMSQQIFGVLHQQDEGAQVVVSKQLTPLLAVVHDFNIGIEQYIPKQMGASIYTFRAVLNNFTKTDTLSAGMDWFGRLNATYQHKWGASGASSTISTHISNGGGGEVTSVTAQSDYRGSDFQADVAVEGVDSAGGKDVSVKGSYMQSLTHTVAAGAQCKVGLMSGTTEAKLRARYTRGDSVFTGAVGCAVAAAGAPVQLSNAQVTVTRQVTKSLALSAKATYGLSPQSGQPEATAATAWAYQFRDRMISGAVTTEGKVVTQYMQMLGGMRWAMTGSVDHSKGSMVGFGCLFEVMS